VSFELLIDQVCSVYRTGEVPVQKQVQSSCLGTNCLI